MVKNLSEDLPRHEVVRISRVREDLFTPFSRTVKVVEKVAELSGTTLPQKSGAVERRTPRATVNRYLA